MVDLLPGRMTISASAGIGSPGLTKTSLTPGSMPSGSRSSKLAMRARTGTAMTRVGRRTMRAIEIDGIFRRQPCRLRQPRHDAERGPAREARDRRQALIEQSNVAAKLVDDEAVDPRQFVRLQNEMRAGEAGDDAAAIDVPEHHHGHVGCRGKSHIGDVAGTQVDLRRAAGAFDQDDIGIAGEIAQNSPAPPAAAPPSCPDSSWRAACPSACPAR